MSKLITLKVCNKYNLKYIKQLVSTACFARSTYDRTFSACSLEMVAPTVVSSLRGFPIFIAWVLATRAGTNCSQMSLWTNTRVPLEHTCRRSRQITTTHQIQKNIKNTTSYCSVHFYSMSALLAMATVVIARGYLSVCLSVCLSVRLSICLSVHLSVCLSVCPSHTTTTNHQLII